MIRIATDLLAEALFVSDLQMSQNPPVEDVREEILRSLLRHGSDGCTAAMATAFGDYPDTAARRMAWSREMISFAYAGATAAQPLAF